MKQKVNWNLIAQWGVILVCALALKLYYSSASANELRWILAPTTLFVELLSGVSFKFESHVWLHQHGSQFHDSPRLRGS